MTSFQLIKIAKKGLYKDAGFVVLLLFFESAGFYELIVSNVGERGA